MLSRSSKYYIIKLDCVHRFPFFFVSLVFFCFGNVSEWSTLKVTSMMIIMLDIVGWQTYIHTLLMTKIITSQRHLILHSDLLREEDLIEEDSG